MAGWEKVRCNRGIILMCDAKYEHFLPWWFDCYRKRNDYPVAVVDLGLSPKGRGWAMTIGTVIDIRTIQLPLEPPPDFMMEDWQIDLNIRAIKLIKPFALMHSPFAHSAYLDVDCEVKGCIGNLFESPFAVSCIRGEKLYDTGVIAYAHQSPIINDWATMIFEASCHFSTDAIALMEALRQGSHTVDEYPWIYNALGEKKKHPDSLIAHHSGPRDKYLLMQELLCKALWGQTCAVS